MFNSLFAQAAAFSAIALMVFGGLTWFFFFSPLPADREKKALAVRTSPGLTNVLVAALAVVLTGMVVGALWDASMHVKTGEIPGGADFLWPPHLLIYGSFLLSLLVAVFAIARVALSGWRMGVRDPRRWVRANPSLGAVAAAACYALLSIPGDAIWHELFGIDLTAWSPPHLLIALMTAIVGFSAIALWLQKPGVERTPVRRDVVTITLLALVLNLLYIPAVLEWELSSRLSAITSMRPIWLYPLVGGSVALIMLLIARHLTRFRWAATVTALAFYLIRLVITAGLAATNNIAPAFPLFFLLGAFLLDLLPWAQVQPLYLRVLAQVAAFTAGYLPLGLLVLSRRGNLPVFHGSDWLAAGGLLIALGWLFLLLMDWASRRLLSRRVA